LNPYKFFQSLMPKTVQIIAVVQSENADQTSNCLTLAGEAIKVHGVAGRVAGTKVFVDIDPNTGARISGDAPDLPSFDVVI
jgi:hypothetical protein